MRLIAVFLLSALSLTMLAVDYDTQMRVVYSMSPVAAAIPILCPKALRERWLS